MADLVMQPVAPHPWRLHKWVDLDGMVGFLGIARQCRKCNIVEVNFPITQLTYLVAPDQLERR